MGQRPGRHFKPLSLISMGQFGLGALAFLPSFWLIGVWLLSPWLAKPLKIYCYVNLNKKYNPKNKPQKSVYVAQLLTTTTKEEEKPKLSLFQAFS
jgi:hypothetical protein